ncbi:MAG: 23S rRNA (adenine(2030)-N(6))-methyltransferase RlmJ [Pseudomonadota bacterium]
MLSYRHAFHAGNLADVHKHAALAAMLTLLQRKARGYCYVDTHAGVGRYRLDGDDAGEWREGVGRVRASAEAAPQALAPYLDCLRRLGDAQYPGSPWLASQLAREQDSALLFELHPQDGKRLKSLFKGDRQVAVHAPRDAREGLPALLPLGTPRGLVLVDPSYERLDEYAEPVRLLITARQRWATATVVLWYPLLGGPRAGRHDALLRDVLAQQVPGPILRSELHAKDPARAGLIGSGLLVANPPWPFAEQWPAVNGWLAGVLAECASAGHTRDDWLVPEANGGA